MDRFSIEESEYGETDVRCNKCGWYGEKHMLDQNIGRMTEQYVVIIRHNGQLESWVDIDAARRRANQLRDEGVDCDIYSKVIE
jgi:hypothetical protein